MGWVYEEGGQPAPWVGGGGLPHKSDRGCSSLLYGSPTRLISHAVADQGLCYQASADILLDLYNFPDHYKKGIQ